MLRKKVLYKGGIERDDSHFICTVTLEGEIFEFVCLRVPSNETTHFRVSRAELCQRLNNAFDNSIIPKIVSHLHLIDGKITFEVLFFSNLTRIFPGFESPYEQITRQTEDERAAVKIQAQWKGHQIRKEKKVSFSK